MNPAIRNILRSLLITGSISLGFSLAAFILSKSFSLMISIFICTFILQFIVFYFWQSWILNKAIRSEDDLYRAYIQQIEKQSIQLNCAYCRTSNNTAISINEENVFMCKSCNQENVIMMEFSTAQRTTPQDQNAVLTKIKDLTEPLEFKS